MDVRAIGVRKLNVVSSRYILLETYCGVFNLWVSQAMEIIIIIIQYLASIN